MARSVAEWRGRTPDSAIPLRVRLRVWERGIGHCEECGRKIMTGEKWEIDHRKALINGGENREGNLAIVCLWCHRAKTRADVAEKSRTYKRRASHIGVKRKRPSFATNRDGPYRKKMDGTTVRR